MSENEELEDEVVDVEPYEGEPDFVESPTATEMVQDMDFTSGEALGDDLSEPEVTDA